MTDDADNLISDLRLNADHQLLIIEDYRRAADRIEKLEAALREIATPDWIYDAQGLRDMARKALEGKENE